MSAIDREKLDELLKDGHGDVRQARYVRSYGDNLQALRLVSSALISVRAAKRIVHDVERRAA